MAATLSLVFFLSGAAALLFEALWLRGGEDDKQQESLHRRGPRLRAPAPQVIV